MPTLPLVAAAGAGAGGSGAAALSVSLLLLLLRLLSLLLLLLLLLLQLLLLQRHRHERQRHRLREIYRHRQRDRETDTPETDQRDQRQEKTACLKELHVLLVINSFHPVHSNHLTAQYCSPQRTILLKPCAASERQYSCPAGPLRRKWLVSLFEHFFFQDWRHRRGSNRKLAFAIGKSEYFVRTHVKAEFSKTTAVPRNLLSEKNKTERLDFCEHALSGPATKRHVMWTDTADQDEKIFRLHSAI